MKRTGYHLAAACLLLGALGGSAAAKTALPRIMILMDERNVGGYSIEKAQLTLAGQFLKEGFQVVDSDLVKSKLKRDQALQSMTGSDQAAAALGLELGAEVVIVGNAVAKGSATHLETTKMRSYQGTVGARAIRADTAELVAVADATASAAHLDESAGGSEAIGKASREVAATLVKALQKGSGAGGTKTRRVQLVIGDVKQIWQLAAIKQALQEKVNGTSDVTRRGFVTGVATYELNTAADVDALSQDLVLIRDEPFRFQVVGIAPGKIDARLVMTE